MYIDYAYYTDTYKGSPMEEDTFNRLSPRAFEIVDMICRQQISAAEADAFSPACRSQIQKAIAAQTEYIYVNGGTDFIQDSGRTQSYKIGSFTAVNKEDANGLSLASPFVYGHLLLSGLLYGGAVTL